MNRTELIEWIVIMLCVVLWWPRIFWGYDALLYHLILYYGSPLALILIFVRRYRRVKAGLDYSRSVVDSQRLPGPPNPPPTP